jgi:alpha-beta hydrolase superfamily lysophospholipase
LTKGRFAQFPSYLAERSRTYKFGEVPVLLAHPDWGRPAPVMLWMHGRTAYKEMDPGRYIRWIRAGFAACAIDLPGHGERANSELQSGKYSPAVIAQAVGEVDRVLEALAAPEFKGAFDLQRPGIGGMSLGGMVTLRRLCDPHTFSAAAVEATTGWLEGLYFGTTGLPPGAERENPLIADASPELGTPNLHSREQVAQVDPMQHLQTWRPIPLLALHSEADRLIPVGTMRAFIEQLRQRYAATGANPTLVEFKTWPETGAPDEHIGFGRVSNDAKNLQAEFLRRELKA